MEDTVDSLFRRQASRAGSAVAISCGDHQLTYAQLDQQATRCARALRAEGVGPESVVALLSERSPEMIAAVLGIFRAGAAYLPLDPKAPAEPQARSLLLSRAAALVASPALFERGQALVGRARPPLPLLELSPSQAPEGGELPPSPHHPESLAYVIFTSGSTGVPKGAMLEQRGLVNHLQAMVLDLGLTADDVIAQTASACFDLSIWQMLGALVVGGRTAVFPDEVANQPSALLRTLEDQRVTVAELVPSVLQAACASAARRGDRRPPLTALRWMVSTGEALSSSLCAQWFSLYPRVPLVNAYGPTECSDDVALHFLRRAPEELSIPIGVPIANVQAYVLDQQLRPAAVEDVGELYVGGAGVGRGYLADPVRTAQAFLPDPVSKAAGARMYRTGDQARRRADGALEYLGRVDHQVKLRGIRVELGEVEAAVASHPSVSEAVVVAVGPDSTDRSLAAYVTLLQPLSSSELLAYLQGRLPEHLVPAVVVFLERFPVSTSGKIDRRALPSP